jgi:hypothetical protein
MGPVMVVVVDPGTEFESGLFDGLEAVAPTELFFEGFDETLAQAVLLRWSVPRKSWTTNKRRIRPHALTSELERPPQKLDNQ